MLNATLNRCLARGVFDSYACTLLVLSSQVEDYTNASHHTNIRPGYRGKFSLKQLADWQLDPSPP